MLRKQVIQLSSVSCPGRMAEKTMLIDHSVLKNKTHSVHVKVRLSLIPHHQTGRVVRRPKQYGCVESAMHKTHLKSGCLIILHTILYSVFSTKVTFSFPVSNFGQAFKCHHVIFIGIKSQMSHKPMKTAYWFADYIQFMLRKEPRFFFFPPESY